MRISVDQRLLCPSKGLNSIFCLIMQTFNEMQGYPRPWIAMVHFHAIAWNSLKPNSFLI